MIVKVEKVVRRNSYRMREFWKLKTCETTNSSGTSSVYPLLDGLLLRRLLQLLKAELGLSMSIWRSTRLPLSSNQKCRLDAISRCVQAFGNLEDQNVSFVFAVKGNGTEDFAKNVSNHQRDCDY